ncbi:hypothetical protein FEE95_01675 [Maribacter algarum]|uniref:Glycine dehydrogenase n=1 Tax=Maribacter algarum (ex Zhang et al. 2020) TaxID=2578118 RepID=A0A5S3PVE3_9FLAO|nr:hypothetical protein FEE95_01675 [Maribacter algarum]
MISCEKAAIICNKTQYDEASFMEKLKLRYHLFMCKTCSAFTKKNTEFTTLCQKANLQSLSEAEKLKMKEQLQGKH